MTTDIPTPLADITNTTLQQVDGERVYLKLCDPHGNVSRYRLKRATPFIRLFLVYCEQNPVERNRVRFLFDGARISDFDTPASLQMEDDDIIDVVMMQTGGGEMILVDVNELYPPAALVWSPYFPPLPWSPRL